MRRIWRIALLVLAVYSVVLLATELATSQDFVRNFFTDIEGPVPFYAVNTTLSVFLLWATATIFAVCLVCTEGMPDTRRLQRFFLSQVLVFAFLGLDDRFKAHEYLAWQLGVGDHYVLLSVAAMEVVFLVVLGGRTVLESRAARCLFGASLLFGGMVFFDACVQHDMVLRLSLEDLAKSWASLLFFAFAWLLCTERIEALKHAAQQPSEGHASWQRIH